MAKTRSARSSAALITRLLSALAVVVIVGLAGWAYQARHSSFIVRATTHQPETYTELYFLQPAQLSTNVQSGQNLRVSFAIHNVEARNVKYTYDIDLTTASGQTTLLSQRQAFLANGATQQIVNDTALPTLAAGRAEISVVLLNHPETIHYWVEVTA